MYTPPIPSDYNLVYTRQQIDARVRSLGEEIRTWAALYNTQPVAVCVLRGGVIFFADLLRAINASLEPAFCRTWSYSSESNLPLTDRIAIEDDHIPCEGRPLLVVDDICDSGHTLKALTERFAGRGALEVRSCVLIRRDTGAPAFVPDWTGFNYDGDTWFVGYGMEDKNRFANLPEIYGIDPG